MSHFRTNVKKWSTSLSKRVIMPLPELGSKPFVLMFSPYRTTLLTTGSRTTFLFASQLRTRRESTTSKARWRWRLNITSIPA